MAFDGERQREKRFSLCCFPPQMTARPELGQFKAKINFFFQAFHAGAWVQGLGPSFVIFCRELDFKWGSRDLNWYLYSMAGYKWRTLFYNNTDLRHLVIYSL